jgi:tetratricopeptide (TPR) repeat protein
MKRSRSVTPGLKHLAFFEELADVSHETPSARAAIAGLLTLRLVDHWVLAGAVMVEPESVSVRSVRQAIMAIAANDPQREVLLGVVNVMQTLREVDMQPVLPRLFAFAELTEKRGMLALAADVYASVIRLGEENYDGDLIMDSSMRLGYCLRMMGVLQQAEDAYVNAGRIAKRRRELARVLRSRIGLANVAVARGNLPAADDMLAAIAIESLEGGVDHEYALAVQDRAVVARMRGEHTRSVCLAYEALERLTSASERERVLSDISATFVAMGRFEEARMPLLIQEATAALAETRCIARVNLMSLAARSGDEALFRQYRESLAETGLPPQIRANALIETARGLRRFGNPEEAARLLEEARDVARSSGLNSVLQEADALLASTAEPVYVTSGGTAAFEPDPAAHVVVGLRQLLASVGA